MNGRTNSSAARLLGAGLVVLVGLAVTGCATEPASAPAASTAPVVAGSTLAPPVPTAPRPGVPEMVGTCRRDASDRAVASSSNEAANVRCTEPHGFETYAVDLLPAEWGAAPYPERNTDAYDRLIAAERAICTTDRFDAYLGVPREATVTGERRPLGALSWAWFIPDRVRWAAGERWLRCDLRVAWSDPGGSLTASVRGRYPELQASPDAALCRIGTGDTAVPCGRAHAYEGLTTYTKVVGGRPAEDGDRAALEQWRRICREDLTRYLGTPQPAAGLDVRVTAALAAEWEKGDDSRSVSCEAALKEGDVVVAVSGSLRGLGERAPTRV
jgi:hypothetical protein